MTPCMDSGLAPPRGPDGRFTAKPPLVILGEGESQSTLPSSLRFLLEEVKAATMAPRSARTLLSLCRGALPRLAASPLPGAEAIAMALVLAAVETAEVAVLRRGPEQVLNGSAAFRGRWIAFAALLAFTPRVDEVRLAAALGIRALPRQQLMAQLGGVRGASWFSEEGVVRVFVGLADDVLGFAQERVREVLAASDATDTAAA